MGSPLGGARIDPGGNGVNLRLRQRAIVLELLRMPILKPGRHRSTDNHPLHRALADDSRILIGQHRDTEHLRLDDGSLGNVAARPRDILVNVTAFETGPGHWNGGRVWRGHPGHSPNRKEVAHTSNAKAC